VVSVEHGKKGRQGASLTGSSAEVQLHPAHVVPAFESLPRKESINPNLWSQSIQTWMSEVGAPFYDRVDNELVISPSFCYG